MTPTRLLARPMLASMFLAGGINALRHTDQLAARARPAVDKTVPKIQQALPDLPIPSDPKTLVRANAAVHLLGGLALATGRVPRLSALALAASMVPTTLVGHPFWEASDPTTRATQRVEFFKNLSMVGGLLLAGVDTEGRPGLAWRARRAAADASRGARQLRKTARREAKLAAKSVTK